MPITQIQKDSVVSLYYLLRDKEGQVIDQTQPGDPLHYLHGHDNIVPGLEKQLENLKVGDKRNIEVLAIDAYGPYDEEKCFGIERASLPKAKLKPGMILELTPDDSEPFLARIVEIHPDHVAVDANHPMAGKDLFFDIEVVALRDATPEELTHGHVHTPGAEHHA